MSDTQNNQSPNPKNSTNQPNQISLIPKGITIGLAIFSLLLSLSGYAFRLAMGDKLSDVLRHAIIIVPCFVIIIPLLFWLGASLMNRWKKTNIQVRNALTLGWLISCVAILWLMGTYS